MRLNDNQGRALTQLAHALRPDWNPTSTGKVLATANQAEGFPAQDFPHAVRALLAYATATTPNGDHKRHTPAFYAEPGPHWTTTATQSAPTPHNAPRCPDHDTFHAHNCPPCIADVKVGDRPATMIGKHYDPQEPEP